MKIKIILLFFLINSCKSINSTYQIENFLIPIKVGLLNYNHKESYNKQYKIACKKSSTENIQNLLIDNVLILNIINNLDRNYMFEVFNEKYLIISEYSNIGAAGPELMNRTNIYLIDIPNPTKIYYLEDEIRLTSSEEHLVYYKNSTTTHKIYCITGFLNGNLFLKSNNGEVNNFTMTELEIGETI